MKLLQKIGKGLVNFSIKRLGVKPYDTDLLPLPKTPPLLDTKSYYPIKIEGDLDINIKENIPQHEIIRIIANEIANHQLFKESIKIYTNQTRPRTISYYFKVAVMPVEYLERE